MPDERDTKEYLWEVLNDDASKKSAESLGTQAKMEEARQLLQSHEKDAGLEVAKW